jgi:hypothetical protein
MYAAEWAFHLKDYDKCHHEIKHECVGSMIIKGKQIPTLNVIESNALLGRKLFEYLHDQKEPFATVRVGSIEVQTMMQLLSASGDPVSDTQRDSALSWFSGRMQHQLQNNAGVYPPSFEEATKFALEYKNGIASANLSGLVGVFDTSIVGSAQTSALLQYAPNAVAIHTRALEPFYHVKPWSACLRGKTLLVVHPFAETIKKQYKKHSSGKRIWMDPTNDILPPLKALKLVKSEVSLGRAVPSHARYINQQISRCKNVNYQITKINLMPLYFIFVVVVVVIVILYELVCKHKTFTDCFVNVLSN